MSLTIYQVREAESFIQRIWREQIESKLVSSFHGLSTGSKVAVGAAAATGALVAATVAVEAAAAAYAAAIAASVATWVFGEGPYPIKVISESYATKFFKHFQGEKLHHGFYIEHPRKEGILFPASRFHAEIEKEQVHEIVKFLRANLLLKRYKIVRVDEERGSVSAKSRDIKSAVDFQAAYNNKATTLIEWTYPDPEVIPLTERLVWMNKFEIIRASVGGCKAKSGVCLEDLDLSFGIRGSVAKQVGFSEMWLKKKTLVVEIESLSPSQAAA